MLSLLSGALLAAAALWLYAERLPFGQAEARSAAMAVLIAGGLLLVIAERGTSRTVRLFVVCSAVALSLPLAVHFGPLAHALQLAPLDAWEWVRALLLALAAIAWRRFVR